MTDVVPILPFLGEAAASLPGVRDNDLITILLILVLGMALGVGLICLLLVVHFLRSGRLAQRRMANKEEWWFSERKFQASIFTTPTRWLAVRCGNPLVVQAALGLNRPTPCSWEEGLSVAHDQKLFISPPISGWILVMGSALPEPSEDVDHCFRFLQTLSRKLGHVQFFSVNRVVHHHAWVQAEHGQIQRAYAWAGKTLWNQGPATLAEVQLGLKCYGYTETMERTSFLQQDPAALNAERVSLLAARWSVDPNTIDGRRLRACQGIAGDISRSRAT
ncbi:MAG: hypothetical protein JWM16_3763 [Verrucomicrobiales bacterium]|nr:hypothetical protein [Verrucomicrobiales bacterium]